MKADFGNGFHVEMNEPTEQSSGVKLENVTKMGLSFVFGLLSFFASIFALIVRFAGNMAADMYLTVFEVSNPWIAYMFFVVCLILGILSIAFSIFSIIYFARAPKKKNETLAASYIVGFVAAIIGIVVTVVVWAIMFATI